MNGMPMALPVTWDGDVVVDGDGDVDLDNPH